MARGYDQSVSMGNAGEHLVMAHLLVLGFAATRHSLLRVKTTNAASVVWTRKKSGITVLDMRNENDYCCVVDMRGGVAAARIFIVPTSVVQSAIDDARADWNAGTRRDGLPRVDTAATRLLLNDRIDHRAWDGFEAKWQQYLGNWEQLGTPY